MQQPTDKDNLNPYPHNAEQAGRAGGEGTGQQKSAEGPKGYASAKENTPDFNPGIEMPQTPQMELPKGGGAIQGIGEKFEANPVTGTASFQVPLTLSPGRNGFTPQLTLSYDSGRGSSPFGLGWDIGIPQIIRQTSRGLPTYRDAEEKDIFVLSGAEDLIPLLKEEGGEWVKDTRTDGDYTITRYRPRIEGLFAYIERWEHRATHISHWRTITRDNIISLFGTTTNSRVFDPQHPERIFQWNLEKTWDDKGNVIEFEYAEENLDGVNTSVNEKHRLSQTAFPKRYLKQVRYGNTEMHDGNGDLPQGNDWMFYAVFDYGDHNSENPQLNPSQDWAVREDPYSNYRPGFEVRTWRLCRRMLMFHKFEQLKGDGQGNAVPVLVKATELQHQPNPTATLLTSVTHRCFDPVEEEEESYPPVEFTYTEAQIDHTVHTLETDDLNELPGGVNGSQLSWNDFENCGIPGILADYGDAWYFKRNRGDRNLYESIAPSQQPTPELHFDPFVTIAQKPMPGTTQQLSDIDGDGRQEVVVRQPPLQGYFKMDDQREWQNFMPFESTPNINWEDPNLRMLDLDGDGLADVLLTTDQCLRWYRNDEGKGYEWAGDAPLITDENHGPALVFADAEQSIYTADMSGDGLTDLVRVRQNEVCYWPNLGHGRFGQKVTLAAELLFDHPEQFNQQHIRLADVDGSGTTDIIYLGSDIIAWWANQSGNSLSLKREIPNFPGVDNLTSVNVLDILGRGTGCLVWSSPLEGDYPGRIRYVDLMGQKPYLLSGILNNMGSEQRMRYTPSTSFYLRDLRNGNPWVTQLHFPVQTLSRVEVFDHISKTRLITRYAYHHGYYDRHEREFRGFGMVEQWDTEEVDFFGEPGLFPVGSNEEDTYALPPVYTKTWFHNGYFEEMNRVSQQFKKEYYQGDGAAWYLPDSILPQGLSATEWREAHRALKGQPLRSEVYHINEDGSVSEPYTVSESNYRVKRIQPKGKNRFASFQTLPEESLSYQYEQNPADPRIAHELTLETDLYGMPLRSAHIAYPRRGTGHPIPQSRPLMVLTKQEYIHLDDQTNALRLGIPYRVEAWEITGLAAGNLLSADDLDEAFDNASAIDYLTTPNYSSEQKRLLAKTEAEYYNAALSAALPLGEAAMHALPYQSYSLALTDAVKSTVYGSYSEVDDTLLANEGGYAKRGSDFYAPSGIFTFDDAAFFTIEKTTDPFGEETLFEYDPYHLMALKTTDALGNEMSVEPDYRVLAPWQVTDPNGNRQQVAFDARGMVVKTAVMGKQGDSDGDTLSNPTGILEYGLFNWMDHGQPNYAHSLMRETHQDSQTRWLESYTYTDGLGRELLQKIKVKPGDAFIFVDGELQYDNGEPEIAYTANRWVGTGRTIYNNKGLPVKQYEPYFSNTEIYEKESDAREFGVSPLLLYDPLGRNIQTQHPDGSFEKVEFDCWEQKNYDRNDTVVDSDWYTERNSPNPSGSEPTDPDERAAWLAAHHYNTPQVLKLDVFGRSYLMQDDNGSYNGTQTTHDLYDTTFFLDIEGKQRSYTNALAQETTFIYNMLPLDEEGNGMILHTDSPDGGWRLMLQSVTRNPILAWDERGHAFAYGYDKLQRPTHVWVNEGAGDKLVNFMVYGDNIGLTNPENDNLRGQVIRAFDQSGMSKPLSIDFKGNITKAATQLAVDFKDTVDWTDVAEETTLSGIDSEAATLLETETFTTETVFDALNRPTLITQPDGSLHRPGYNDAGMLSKMEVQLAHESSFTEYVEDIEYDAKGQRTDIFYGNGSKTRYDYDPKTFRLTRLLTTRNTGSDILQDLNYTYDPVGNIVEMVDDAQQTNYFSNTVIEPKGKYTYDSLYRLLKATGRELAGLNAPTASRYTPDFVPTDGQSGQTLQTYCEQYTYDALGNILELSHRDTCGGTENWKRTYEYNTNKPNNYLQKAYTGSTPPSSPQFTYDAHGNLLEMTHLNAMTWDFEDQLKTTEKTDETTYYVYAGGERVRKVCYNTATNKLKHERIYLGGYEIYREYDASEDLELERTSNHVMDDRNRIAILEVKTMDNGTAITPENQVTVARYQYSNHLGSASLELNEDAEIISYQEYHPFGSTSYELHTNDSEVSLKRYQYVGKERDGESGLYYYGARYYADWLCRFVSVDPLKDGYPFYSSFQYTGGNPISFYDLDGNEPTDNENTNVETSQQKEYNVPIRLVDFQIERIGRLSERLETIGQAVLEYEELLGKMEDLMNEHQGWSIGFLLSNPLGSLIMQLDYLIEGIDEKFEQRVLELEGLYNEFNEVLKEYNRAKGELISLLEVSSGIEFEGGIVFHSMASLAIASSIHKNRNIAIGNFAVYEIKINEITFKFGVADADRTTQSNIEVVSKDGSKRTIPKGTPIRLYQQERKLIIEHGASNVRTNYTVHENTTKINVKTIESSKVWKHLELRGHIPKGNVSHQIEWNKKFGASKKGIIKRR